MTKTMELLDRIRALTPDEANTALFFILGADPAVLAEALDAVDLIHHSDNK